MGQGRSSGRVSAAARRLLEAGVAGQVFPGAVATVAYRVDSSWEYEDAFAGELGSGRGKVNAQTPYDLASITKPFAAVIALRLVAARSLDLSARVETFLTDLRGTPTGQATIEALLLHRAGLAPWGGLYLDVPHEIGSAAARRWIVNEAARRLDEDVPPNSAIYSDLGYIVAGAAITKAAGAPLDRLLVAHVTAPLGIVDDVFYATSLAGDRRAKLLRTAAPTERCEWRGRIVVGEPHDENCAALGGIAAHAGLFGTAHGVARFGAEMLDVLAGRSTFLPKALLEDALADRDGATNRLGWDTKSPVDSSAGKRMGPRTFGHLGFTGTSIWCDPELDVVVTLLTNRIHPSRANQKIKGFRPAFHDGVVAAVDVRG